MAPAHLDFGVTFNRVQFKVKLFVDFAKMFEMLIKFTHFCFLLGDHARSARALADIGRGGGDEGGCEDEDLHVGKRSLVVN